VTPAKSKEVVQVFAAKRAIQSFGDCHLDGARTDRPIVNSYRFHPAAVALGAVTSRHYLKSVPSCKETPLPIPG